MQERWEAWLQLVHSYLLPVLTLYQEDLAAVHMAKQHHQHVLLTLDQDIEDLSAQIVKVWAVVFCRAISTEGWCLEGLSRE